MTGMIGSIWRRLDMLAAMSPSDVYGIADLARLWGTSKPTADRWTQVEGFPEVRRMNTSEDDPEKGVKYVDAQEVREWMASRVAQGLPVPGGTGGARSPDLKPRKRRGSPTSED